MKLFRSVQSNGLYEKGVEYASNFRVSGRRLGCSRGGSFPWLLIATKHPSRLGPVVRMEDHLPVCRRRAPSRRGALPKVPPDFSPRGVASTWTARPSAPGDLARMLGACSDRRTQVIRRLPLAVQPMAGRIDEAANRFPDTHC